jgi:hypothetical protein
MYLARIFENRSYPIVPRPTTQHERENEGERVHDRIEVSASGWVQRRLGRMAWHARGGMMATLGTDPNVMALLASFWV